MNRYAERVVSESVPPILGEIVALLSDSTIKPVWGRAAAWLMLDLGRGNVIPERAWDSVGARTRGAYERLAARARPKCPAAEHHYPRDGWPYDPLAALLLTITLGHYFPEQRHRMVSVRRGPIRPLPDLDVLLLRNGRVETPPVMTPKQRVRLDLI